MSLRDKLARAMDSALVEHHEEQAEERRYFLHQVKDKERIIKDLKEALREYAAKPAIKDPVLIEALVRGISEEGSVGTRGRGY